MHWDWADCSCVPTEDCDPMCNADWSGGFDTTYLFPAYNGITASGGYDLSEDHLLTFTKDSWDSQGDLYSHCPTYTGLVQTSLEEISLTSPPNAVSTPALSLDESVSASVENAATDVDTLVKTIQTVAEVTLSSSQNSPLASPVSASPPARQGQERPYRCPITSCGKSFTRKTRLKIHARIHDTHKLYVCAQVECLIIIDYQKADTIFTQKCHEPGCGQSFAQRGNLKVSRSRLLHRGSVRGLRSFRLTSVATPGNVRMLAGNAIGPLRS